MTPEQITNRYVAHFAAAYERYLDTISDDTGTPSELCRNYGLVRQAGDYLDVLTAQFVSRISDAVNAETGLIQATIAPLARVTVAGRKVIARKSVAKQLAQDLLDVNRSIAGDLLKTTLQMKSRLVSAKKIDEILMQGVLEGQSQREMQDIIRQTFLERLKGKQTLTIRGREYRVTKYVDMVVKNRVAALRSEAAINSAILRGEDLVQWKTCQECVTPPCKICIPFDGMRFSVTGNTQGYPILREPPPIHVFCRCHVVRIPSGEHRR